MKKYLSRDPSRPLSALPSRSLDLERDFSRPLDLDLDPRSLERERDFDPRSLERERDFEWRSLERERDFEWRSLERERDFDPRSLERERDFERDLQTGRNS